MEDLSYNYRVSRAGSNYRAICAEFPEVIVYAKLPDQALSLIKDKVSRIIQDNRKNGISLPFPIH